MTQKDLSTRISEKPNVVADYESGRAIPNPQILGKMERVLGIKLRGKNIGAPVSMPILTSLAARKSSDSIATVYSAHHGELHSAIPLSITCSSVEP